MTVSQNMNQFAQAALKGSIAAIVNPVTLSVQIDPASTHTVANATPIVPGDAVVLKNVAGNMIVVDKAAVTDTPLGFVIYTPKKDKFYAMDSVEIALPGSVIWVEASATVARGANLEYVVGSSTTASTVKTNAGVNPICGIALDKGSSGALMRMLVQTAVAVSSSFANILITTAALNGATATLAIDPTAAGVGTLTPTMNSTYSFTTNAVAGSRYVLVITTSGSSAFILTGGSSVKSAGTLNTGTANAKVFTMEFVCDGTNWNEIARTTAM